MTVRILVGDVLAVLPALADRSVQTCVTSPPYWGLRDYGVEGQIGLERTPEEYVEKLVGVFREVRRVLRADGTLWLNLGDLYVDGGRGADVGSTLAGTRNNQRESRKACVRATFKGLRPKNLVGIPWRVAFALQADGWYLRSDIIWAKPNAMPESVTDRPTKAHEYLFLLAKSPSYYYDANAIREPVAGEPNALRNRWDTKDYVVPGQKPQKRTSRQRKPAGWETGPGAHGSFHRDGRAQEVEQTEVRQGGRNKRSVWTVATFAYPDAHFATFPPALIEPCVVAGSRRGDVVLDPFGGAGTTGLVADRLGRDAVLIELNPEYADMARERIRSDAPLFASEAS